MSDIKEGDVFTHNWGDHTIVRVTIEEIVPSKSGSIVVFMRDLGDKGDVVTWGPKQGQQIWRGERRIRRLTGLKAYLTRRKFERHV